MSTPEDVLAEAKKSAEDSNVQFPSFDVEIVKETRSLKSLNYLVDDANVFLKSKEGDPKEDSIRQRIKRANGRGYLAVITRKPDQDVMVKYGPRNLICRAMIPKTVVYVENILTAIQMTVHLRKQFYLNGLDKLYADQAVTCLYDQMLPTTGHLILRQFLKPEKGVNVNEKSKHRILIVTNSPYQFITDNDVAPRVIMFGKLDFKHMAVGVSATCGGHRKVAAKWFIDPEELVHKKSMLSEREQAIVDAADQSLREWRFKNGIELDDETLNAIAHCSEIMHQTEHWPDFLPGISDLIEHVREDIEDVVELAYERASE